MVENISSDEVDKRLQLLINNNKAVKLNTNYLCVKQSLFYCCLCEVAILLSDDGSHLIAHCFSVEHNEILDKITMEFMKNIKAEPVVGSSLGCHEKFRKALLAMAESFPFNKITCHSKLISIKNNTFYCNSCNKSIQFTTDALKVKRHFENICHIDLVSKKTFSKRVKIEHERVVPVLPSGTDMKSGGELNLKETKTTVCEKTRNTTPSYDINCKIVLENIFGENFDLLDIKAKETISRNIIHLEKGENCFFCLPCKSVFEFGNEISLNVLVIIGLHCCGKKHEKRLNKLQIKKECLPKTRRKLEELSKEEKDRLNIVIENNKLHLLMDQKSKIVYCLLCKSVIVSEDEENTYLSRVAFHCDGKYHQWNLKKLSCSDETNIGFQSVGESLLNANEDNMQDIFRKVVMENKQYIENKYGDLICLLCKIIVVSGEEDSHSLQKLALHCETKDHKSKRRKLNNHAKKKKKKRSYFEIRHAEHNLNHKLEQIMSVEGNSLHIENKDGTFYCILCKTIIECGQDERSSLHKVALHCATKVHKRRQDKINNAAEKEEIDLSSRYGKEFNVKETLCLNDTEVSFRENMYEGVSDLFNN